MKNKKIIRKAIVLITALTMILGLSGFNAFAGNQTQIKIHLDENVPKGKLTVTIDGVDYSATSKGSFILVEMGSTDNGVHMEKDGKKEVQFQFSGSDEIGTMILTHQEGNGTFIEDENDNGSNNFNGVIKSEEPDPEDPDPEEIIEDEEPPSR